MMKIKLSQLIIFSWVLATCPSVLAIRNGERGQVGELTAVGFLDPACTATLISPNVILTANHCLEQAASLEFANFTITLANGTSQTIGAAESRVMNSYLPQELALVRLKENVTGVSIPGFLSSTENIVGKSAVITGYGVTVSGATQFLLKGDVVISQVGNVDLGDGAAPMIVITPGARLQLPCPGDSGGPLLVDGKIAGIASFTDADSNLSPMEQCASVKRAYYVPIQFYREWIEKTLREFGRPSRNNDDWDPKDDVQNPLEDGRF